MGKAKRKMLEDLNKKDFPGPGQYKIKGSFELLQQKYDKLTKPLQATNKQ